jgi:hypothetical protein
VALDVDLEDAPDAAVSAPVPGKSEIVARAETLTFTGLDMKGGKPVFTGMVARGITPVQEAGGDEPEMKIGSIGIEGMNAATGAFIASAFTKEGPGTPPPFEQWAFKSASVKDITIAGEIGGDSGEDSAPDSTPNPTGSLKFEMAELSVANVKDKMIGLTRFGGLKGDVNVPGSFPIAGTFDLGTLDITNIRAGMFSDAFAAGMGAARESGETDWGKVFAGYTSPLEAGIDGIKWSGMSANFSGLRIDGTPASYTAVRNADGVVIETKIPPSAIKLTADASGGSLGAMGMMLMAMGGYPSSVLEVYTQGEATFDPAKDLTRYTNYTVGLTDIAEIKVAGGVLGLKQALPTLLTGLMTVAQSTGAIANEAMDDDGLPKDDSDEGLDEEDGADADADAGDGNPFDKVPPEAQGAVMQMVMGLITLQVTDLDISITDKQMVRLILNQTASASGQSVEAYRQDLVNMITGSKVFMTDAGVEEALAAEVTTAVAGFLSQPGTLRIQLKPKTPFGAMSAMMGMPTKESLGFSATFTPAAPQS